ncbi:MEDS domain-containing protein [Nitrospira moscoviensis]|uniref:MEDS domain-containing protein n=1 Tax=Nitrospira moscoviensis TaxID=42253 RepID=A0A0K2GF47_NITMO|nr:MEDS domain-containing protein [Nitrospira moscoviensis]ALA59232.1 hypothetical protein NITMOv2_2824 [Nitrospira moscoviensis]
MPYCGLDRAGEIGWGSHRCLFYRFPAQLAQVTAAYVHAGLQARELCVWVTTAPVTPASAQEALARLGCDAARYVRSGQLQLVPHEAWYLENGRFDKARMLAKWEVPMRRAESEGYAGLRITGDPAWLNSEEERRAFMEYERDATDLLARSRVVALCTYAASRCSPTDMFDIMAAHPSALVPSAAGWKTVTTGV